MKLFNFFNSSASYRVRIALGLKQLAYECVGVNIRTGSQYDDDFLALNPAGQVPVLVDGPTRLSQSLAIIDYLDRVYPEPPLIPVDGPARGAVLEIAQLIACDVHPLNNLRVLKYLTGELGLSEAHKGTWYAHWIAQGFDTLETMLSDHDGWCVGDGPTLADCCLVPQLANAERMKVELSAWPRIRRIAAFARRHSAFERAEPRCQPDYIAP
jgi:maleylacetoacetate isomerase